MPDAKRNRPIAANDEAGMSLAGDNPSVSAFDAFADHFRARVAADAFASALAATWQRRAAAFDAARPRPGDFRGRATDADLAARDARLAAQAAACRARAAVSLFGGAA